MSQPSNSRQQVEITSPQRHRRPAGVVAAYGERHAVEKRVDVAIGIRRRAEMIRDVVQDSRLGRDALLAVDTRRQTAGAISRDANR